MLLFYWWTGMMEEGNQSSYPPPYNLEIWMPLFKKTKALFFCHRVLSFCLIQNVSFFYKINRTDLLGFAWTMLGAASLHQGVLLFLGLLILNSQKMPLSSLGEICLILQLKPPTFLGMSPASAHFSCCVSLSVPCSAERLCLWAPSQHFKAWPQLRLFLFSVRVMPLPNFLCVYNGWGKLGGVIEKASISQPRQILHWLF